MRAVERRELSRAIGCAYGSERIQQDVRCAAREGAGAFRSSAPSAGWRMKSGTGEEQQKALRHTVSLTVIRVLDASFSS